MKYVKTICPIYNCRCVECWFSSTRLFVAYCFDFDEWSYFDLINRYRDAGLSLRSAKHVIKLLREWYNE